MIARRTSLSLVAGLIALLLISGTAMPSSWLWQCRHGHQVVAAPIASPASAMPCQMMGTMAGKNMPCCRMRLATLAGRNWRGPVLQAAPCRPAFVKIASLPEGAPSSSSASRDNPPPQDMPANAQAKPSAIAGPVMQAFRQRPPPVSSVSPAPVSLPGLRAPPASTDFAG